MKRSVKRSVFIFTSVGFLTLSGFQNCSSPTFSQVADAQQSSADPQGTTLGTPTVCNGVSCSLDPLTTKAAVTTVLLALGDQANNELVIGGASAQLIAETLVRTSSPQTDPKILFVWDSTANTETSGDRQYVLTSLLNRYNVTALNVPTSGLKASDLAAYDLVWFTNPGYPMSNAATRDALVHFSGGVILEGDDLAHGSGFDLQPLTGLHYVDNGTSIVCGSHSFNTDNNSGTQFDVRLDSQYFAGSDSTALEFHYGNDIDNSTVVGPNVQVLAWAKGSPSECTALRPAIVRYEK